MTMTDEIFALAKHISACTLDEETLLEQLCMVAEKELYSRLRVPEEECREEFICAAAWTAVADLICSRCGTDEPEHFRAGDISVQNDTNFTIHRAILLRRTARRMMERYCQDDDFCFRGING